MAAAHLGKIRKQREQFFLGPVRRVRPHRLAAYLEVFIHSQVGEDAPLFRHVTKPAADDRVRRLRRDVPTLEHDAAAALLDQTDDGAKSRRLAGAIASKQRDDFALADFKRDVEQDVSGAVIAVEPLDQELHTPAPSRWRAS